MVFYLNLFQAIKFALKVINMNRPAPNLQLGLGTNYDVGSFIQEYFLLQARTVPRNQIEDSSTHLLQCSALIFFAITADSKLSIQLPTSYFVPKPQL